jgi:cell division protease FtsH
MVREFGMSSVLGPVGFASDGPSYLGREEFHRPYAEATQRVIDEEVTRLLRQAEERASDLLRAHGQALANLAQQLIDHETVDGLAVYELLVERPLGVLRDGSVPLKDAS